MHISLSISDQKPASGGWVSGGGGGGDIRTHNAAPAPASASAAGSGDTHPSRKRPADGLQEGVGLLRHCSQGSAGRCPRACSPVRPGCGVVLTTAPARWWWWWRRRLRRWLRLLRRLLRLIRLLRTGVALCVVARGAAHRFPLQLVLRFPCLRCSRRAP